MVSNHYVKCSVCDTTFRLRTQIGLSDITVHFNCPSCNTTISGSVIIPEDPILDQTSLGIRFVINNTVDYKPDSNTAQYLVELSSEFLQQKVVIDNDPFQPSPFIRAFMTYGEKGINNLKRLLDALKRLKKYKNELEIVSNLWNNEKISVLVKKVNEFTLTKLMIDTWRKPNGYKISNTLEMLMVIHQARVFLLSPFIEKDRRERILKYPQTFKEITNSLDFQSLKIFARELGQNNFFVDFEKRMHELTLKYIDLLPDLIPLLNSIEQTKTDITSGIYTITTKHVKTLTLFYAQVYELFCDKIDLIIGMNNIAERGSYEIFCASSNIVGFEQRINSFSSKYKKISTLLCLFDRFSLPFSGLVSNKIRNAESHFTREFNIDKNKIIFIDEHRGKEELIEVDYLIFCEATVVLFNALNELFETSYQMDKIYRISFIRN